MVSVWAPLLVAKTLPVADYWDVTQAPFGDPYAGLYFFEGDEIDAPLNSVGEIYRDFAMGRR